MDFDAIEEERFKRRTHRDHRTTRGIDRQLSDLSEVNVQSADGRIVRVLATRLGADVVIPSTTPLQVYPTVQTKDEVRVSVNPGTIGGIVPTLRGTPIDESPRPESDKLSRSITRMWIKIEWDLENQRPESASIEGGSEVPDNTKTTSHVQIASLQWADPPGGLERINNFLQGSQAAAILGDAESHYLASI